MIQKYFLDVAQKVVDKQIVLYELLGINISQSIYINFKMTKRSASVNIDEKTFQEKEMNEEALQKSEDCAKRTIVKVDTEALDKEVKQPSDKKEEKDEKKEEKSEEKDKPLFSNLFKNDSNGNGVGLFSSVGPFTTMKNQNILNKDPPKIDFKSGNLFSGNGFQIKKAAESTPSLFSGIKTNETFSSIFNFNKTSNIPPVRNGQDDDEGDSAQLQNAQSMMVDKSKSKGKYDYTQEVRVLYSGAVRKYKKNNGDLMENVEVVLQHDEKSHAFYLIVRLMATKNTIFTGYIMEGKSEVRILNKKDENLQISALVINKAKKPELNKIKLQLDTAENGKILFGFLEQVIQGKIKPTEQKEETKEKKQEPAKGEKEEVKETKQ